MSRRIVFFVAIAFISTELRSQIKADYTLTGKHKNFANQLTDGEKRVMERVASKQELKQILSQRQKFRTTYDSLKSEAMQNLGDSTVWQDTDSLLIVREILDSGLIPGKYHQFLSLSENTLKQLNSTDSISEENLVDSWYSILEQQVRSTLSEKELLEGTIPENVGQNPEALVFGEDLAMIQKFKDKLENPNMLSLFDAKTLLAKVDEKSFNKAQKSVAGMKKKYREVLNSEDGTTATHRNSLSHLPTKKRLHLGGMIRAKSTDPLVGEVNLQIGYWLNAKTMTGVSWIVSDQLTHRDSLLAQSQSFGFSLFMRRDVVSNLFLWGEFQHTADQSLFTETANVTDWTPAYLLGIGYDLQLRFITASLLFSYNFNHKEDSFSNRPFSVRVGFRGVKPGKLFSK